ncbi:MAG TPA: hypothetical protein PJ994_02365 [Tepidiformaceae bacterium]|nr:hypothetical protein [Tepidiformaceae bacterium]HMO96492.1 hypothetical protein [Tepidiformaceae bacterium]
MSAVLGGWMCGYAMAILSTFALTYLAVQPQFVDKFAHRFFGPEMPGALLAVPISIGTGVIWTMIGLMLASAYVLGGFEEMPGALGARSWQWMTIMVTLAVLPLPPLMLIGGRFWWLWLTMSVSFAGLFGWLMPLAAER